MVDTRLLRRNEGDTDERRHALIPMYAIENGTMSDVERNIQLLTQLEVQPPFYVFVSIVGTEGATIIPPQDNIFLEPELIQQKELLLPEVVIENVTDNLHHKFRPIFDMVWNAAGVGRSLNFDNNDNFIQRRFG